MALGLNIVVGFAGLLDLGYVAFFAIGAFVMGWLGSQQFPNVNGGKGIHILTPAKSAFGTALPGIHINFFLVIFIAAIFTAIWGVILGAPTLRLRGDYLAIVTLAFGEIVPRVFENSTSGIFGIGNTDFSNGRQGITPIDKINLPVEGHGVQLAAAEAVLLGGAGDARAGDLLQHPPARLAPGPGVDRGARGRGRRGGDGRQPRAHEALGLRDRRGARRLRGRVPRHLQQHGQRRPVRVRLLGVHPLDGHRRRHGEHLGRHARRRRAVDVQPLRAPAAQRRARQGRSELRRDVDQLRHLRLLPAGDDGAATRGLHPVLQTQDRAAQRGRRRRRHPRRDPDPHQTIEARE